MIRPSIGVETLLVYRECACGNWCATGEGAMAPLCGECGEQMWPAGTAVDAEGVPQFGDVEDRTEQRRMRGLAFRAVLANEIALVGGKPLEVAVRLARQAYLDYRTEPYLTPEERRVPECSS
jgi:hypothetical protein